MARGMLRTKSTLFSRFAKSSANALGHPFAFGTALFVILAWAVTGPIFNFSDTWQLVINTGTTIVTFLMVFLIQNTQNRDNGAIQLKLDELIRSTKGAHTRFSILKNLRSKIWIRSVACTKIWLKRQERTCGRDCKIRERLRFRNAEHLNDVHACRYNRLHMGIEP